MPLDGLVPPLIVLVAGIVLGGIRRAAASRTTPTPHGDSMLNSFSDIAACLAGFALAWRRRAWTTLSWVVAVEVFLAVWIRDNLTLNIIMLIHPIQAIKTWQLGA